MSAIFGIINLNGQAVAIDYLERMNTALAIHGSDCDGIWVGGSVGVGQRMMRFTPEDCIEQQPMFSADGKIVLVSDSRIDNRQELAHELGIPTIEAKQLADSAFILQSYQKWGVDCTRHLIGAFAFALWDEREKQLLLARSPMGERAIYYHISAASCAFASMPKGLFALPGISREVDYESLADYLAIAPSEPGRTLYRGVLRLQMGHALLIGQKGIKLDRFWRPGLQPELRLKNDNEYVDAFNVLFKRVVNDHMRSTSPVGVMMSGGLDSTSVAAVVASQLNLRKERLATFTEVPRHGFDVTGEKGRYADETPLVQAMARKYDNLDLNFVRTSGRFFLDDICTLFTAAEIPFYAVPNRTWIEAILQAAKQQDIRVLLTGTTGNLTISWDGRGLLPNLIRHGKWLKAWGEAAAYARHNSATSGLRRLVGTGIMPLMPTPLWTVINRIRTHRNSSFIGRSPWGSYSPINVEFAESQKLFERSREKRFDFSFRPGLDTKSHRYNFVERSDYTRDIMTGYKSLYGIELRDPTCDLRIFEFCLSLPEEQFQCKGNTRWLIKRAMADKLPEEILHNTKRGRQAADWVVQLFEDRNEVQREMDMLERSSLACSVLDIARMRNVAAKLDRSTEAARGDTEFFTILQKGLMAGRFLRWVESGE